VTADELGEETLRAAAIVSLPICAIPTKAGPCGAIQRRRVLFYFRRRARGYSGSGGFDGVLDHTSIILKSQQQIRASHVALACRSGLENHCHCG
jgi:hypothetical protein